MIKTVMAVMAVLLAIGLYSSAPAGASGCGLAEVQVAACGGHYHLRPGQVRRMERRAYRAHRRAMRRAPVYGCAAVPVSYGCAAPRATCAGGVSVITPGVAVTVE